MSAGKLKASLIDLISFVEYINRSNSWAEDYADILALIAQERAEAVGEHISKYNHDRPVPAVDPQKQRLDEFTRAILPALVSVGTWHDPVAFKAMLSIAKQAAIAMMAENDK